MLGRSLGRYRILEEVGAGGMGVVYRAHDERLDRDVALKVLTEGRVGDEKSRKRLREEAKSLSKLNHPNITTVHDFDTFDDVDFLVMEFISGTTVEDMLTSGPLEEEEAVRLALQLAEGLAAAHVQGVIHRDLKPGNLRVTADGRLKILDFGLALLRRPTSDSATTASGLTDAQAVVGTMPYMAPEQLRGESADERTDIYAAGAALYEMVTGQRPFPESRGAERQFIDAVVDTEPNRLSGRFKEALCKQTGGHSLFTVELLRGMKEQGALVQDEEGRWIENEGLDWGTLPARVEAMIGERVERLPDGSREVLRLASVEGEVFTAEVLAQVQKPDEREMVRLLSDELDKRHHLVAAQDIQRMNGALLDELSSAAD